MVETRYVVSADFIEWTNNDCWDFVRHDLYEFKDIETAEEKANELKQVEFYKGESISNIEVRKRWVRL